MAYINHHNFMVRWPRMLKVNWLMHGS